MRRFIAAAVVVLLGSAQVEAGLSYGPYPGYWGISQYGPLGQTFRMPGDRVGRIGVYVNALGGGSDSGIALELYEGSGFGGVHVATRGASNVSGQGWASAWFSGLNLKPGNTYSLRVIDRGTPVGEFGKWWVSQSIWGSTYPHGVSIRFGIVDYTWEDLAFFVTDPLIDDGAFRSGSMAPWSVSGSGSANCLYTPYSGYSAQLTAGSPIQIGQSINTPSEPFYVGLEHSFQSAGTLTVTLESTVLGTIAATEAGSWESERLVVSSSALRGVSDATLAFEFNGVSGSRMLLDNIYIAGVPEPSACGLLAIGSAALALFRGLITSRKAPLVEE